MYVKRVRQAKYNYHNEIDGVQSMYRGIVLILVFAFSTIAWCDEKMFDTHAPKPVDLSLPLDCKALDDELSKISNHAKNKSATKIKLEANMKRATKLKAKRTKLKCGSPG